PSLEAISPPGRVSPSIVSSAPIPPPLDAHVVSWDVYRVRGGTTQGRIGQVVPIIIEDVQQAHFLDYGIVADGHAPPDTNTSGQLYVSPVSANALLMAGGDGQGILGEPRAGRRGLTIHSGHPPWGTPAPPPRPLPPA